MLVRLALAAAVLVGGWYSPDILSIVQDQLPHAHVVTGDPGGGVLERIDELTKERDRGDYFRMEGFCASACTMTIGAIPSDHLCMDEHAVIGFHAAFTGGDGLMPREFSADGTTLLWTYYPKKLQDVLRQHGWSAPTLDQPTLIWLKADDLKGVISICKRRSWLSLIFPH